MQISVTDIVIALLLLVWLVSSILNQFSFAWFDRVRGYDHFSLLPLWTFFAPNPGQSDYHLVYRDKRADDSLTEWREIEITEPRKPFSFFWNPEKRSKKVISDVVSNIVSSIPNEQETGDVIMLSLPYLILLNVVTHFDGAGQTTRRQFILVETFGFNPTSSPRVILRSDFHQMNEERAA